MPPNPFESERSRTTFEPVDWGPSSHASLTNRRSSMPSSTRPSYLPIHRRSLNPIDGSSALGSAHDPPIQPNRERESPFPDSRPSSQASRTSDGLVWLGAPAGLGDSRYPRSQPNERESECPLSDSRPSSQASNTSFGLRWLGRDLRLAEMDDRMESPIAESVQTDDGDLPADSGHHTPICTIDVAHIHLGLSGAIDTPRGATPSQQIKFEPESPRLLRGRSLDDLDDLDDRPPIHRAPFTLLPLNNARANVNDRLPRPRPHEATKLPASSIHALALEASLSGNGSKVSPEAPKQMSFGEFPVLGMAENADIWRTYNDETLVFDKEIVDAWNGTMENFLLFAALFSAVLTAFVAVSYPMLKTDNSQATVDGIATVSRQLAYISLQLANMSGVSVPALGTNSIPEAYIEDGSSSASQWAVTVNGLWVVSLSMSLVTAVVSMLIKQWLREYLKELPFASLQRARHRHFRYVGILAWQVPGIVNALPLVMHLAVFLFLAGLALFIWPASPLLGEIIYVILAIAVMAYLLVLILPFVSGNCPYKSPLSDAISWLISSRKIFPSGWVLFLQALHMLSVFFQAEARLGTGTWPTWLWLFGKPIALLDRSTHAFLAPSLAVSARLPGETPLETMDVLALGWLAVTSSKQETQDASLLALVGSDPSLSKHHVDMQDAIASARNAISARLACVLKAERPIAELQSKIMCLASFSTLLGAQGYSLSNELQKLIISLFDIDEAECSTLAPAFYLFAKGHKARDQAFLDGSYNNTQRDHLKLAIAHLCRALNDKEEHPVPVLGCCLLAEYIRRTLVLDGRAEIPCLREEEHLQELVPSFIASCANIPPQLLRSLLSILGPITAHIGKLEPLPGHGKPLGGGRATAADPVVTPPSIWKADAGQVLLDLLKRNHRSGQGKEEGGPSWTTLGLRLLHCISANASYFDSRNGPLLNFLLSSEERNNAGAPPKRHEAGLTDDRSDPQRQSEVLQAATSLMKRFSTSEGLKQDMAVAFLKLSGPSNSAIPSALTRLSDIIRTADGYSFSLRWRAITFLDSTTILSQRLFGVLSEQIRNPQERNLRWPRCLLSLLLVQNYMCDMHWDYQRAVRLKAERSMATRFAKINYLPRSGWLAVMKDYGLDLVKEASSSTGYEPLFFAMKAIGILAQYQPETVGMSGIFNKFKELYPDGDYPAPKDSQGRPDIDAANLVEILRKPSRSVKRPTAGNGRAGAS